MKVLTRGTVTIDTTTCKGCELCIPACPPQVLMMTSHDVNALGFRYPQLLPGCTGCMACAQICPDFCFTVYKYDTPIEIDAEDIDAEDIDASSEANSEREVTAR